MTPQTTADIAREDACAERIATAWRCSVRRFPVSSPVDYYAERGGFMVALVEIKTHPFASDAYPCCYVDVHKLLQLDLASLGFAVPAVLVKQFTDCTLSIRVAEIARTAARVIGRQDRGRDERHPAVPLFIQNMRPLGGAA